MGTEEIVFWDDRYKSQEYVFGKEPNDFLKENFHYIPQGKVLFLAEGEGRNSVYLAEQGYDTVGVDLSQVGLDKAQRLASQRGVKIQTILADLAKYEIEPDCWEGVVSIFCHLLPGQRKALFAKVQKGLKRGGVFILEAYIPDQLQYKTGGPTDISKLISLGDLKKELPELNFIYAKELVRDVIEGAAHTGKAAVVQLVGLKE